MSFIVFSACISFGQGVSDQPAMPVIYKVTVDPMTGYDSIIWYPVNDGLVDYYAVCYSKITNPAYPFILSDPIAIVSTDSLFYVNKNTLSGQHSIGYSVIAVNVRDDNTVVQSLYDYPDSTVFLSAAFDSCFAEVNLSWNAYNKWRGRIASYKIYQVINGNEPQVVGIIALEEMTSFKLRYIPENQHIGFFVETLHTDSIRTSRSNMVTVFTGMLKIPDFIIASSANPTVNNQVLLSFIVDETTELSDYQLLRSNSIDGNYEIVASFSNYDDNFSFTDDVNFESSVYFYRLAALNKCSEIIRSSNIINNIRLNVTNNGVINQLSWNAIEDWAGDTEGYVLYRRTVESSQTDSVMLTTMLSYSDDVASFFSYNNLYSGMFCYQVKATEKNNPYTTNSVAYSNEICISVTPEIKMPNAFFPNNPSGENNIFRPVFLFEPISYDLVIFNRWGNKIFEGSGPWNGKTGNNPVPEGVYAYQLKVYYPDNTYTKSGYVTVLYPN